MAVTARPYPLAAHGAYLGRFNFEDPDLDLRVLLTTAAYTPAPDTHEFRSHIAGEVAGVGYVAGGRAVTGLSWDYAADLDASVLRCDPVIWPALHATVRRAVVYVDTGDPASSPLLSWVDLGADVTVTGGPLPLVFGQGLYRSRTP